MSPHQRHSEVIKLVKVVVSILWKHVDDIMKCYSSTWTALFKWSKTWEWNAGHVPPSAVAILAPQRKRRGMQHVSIDFMWPCIDWMFLTHISLQTRVPVAPVGPVTCAAWHGGVTWQEADVSRQSKKKWKAWQWRQRAVFGVYYLKNKNVLNYMTEIPCGLFSRVIQSQINFTWRVFWFYYNFKRRLLERWW